ncbi:MAG: transcriptional regulator GutM [Anaerolineaceae bacterium]|jgi:DNA-binding transcriptional regulator of glucitol operon|nr:transcriptional regulator GutM [Anaerolineaceae bacterium]
MLGEYAALFFALAGMWVVQSLMTVWQSNRFMKRFRELRQDGSAAIGSAGTKYKGRVYSVLVVDSKKQIVHAELLSGWTVFAKTKSVDALIGISLSDLMDEEKELAVKKKALAAFRHAGSLIIKKENPDAVVADCESSGGASWTAPSEAKEMETSLESQG